MAGNADLSALFAALIASKAEQRRRLSERTNTSFVGGAAGPAAPSAKDIAFATMRSQGDTSVLRKPVPVKAGRKSFLGSLKEGGSNILSGGQWVLDKLERTSAASTGFVEGLQNPDVNPFEGWWEGLTEKKHGHFADLITRNQKELGAPASHDVSKGIVGFAADVALDPLTYVGVGLVGRGVRGIGKGLKALGIQAPKAVKNKATEEVLSAAERAEIDLAENGSTTVGPNAAKELNNRLSAKTREAYAVQRKPVAEISQYPNPTQTRFEVSPSGDITDIRGEATKGKPAAQLEAMLKLGELQKMMGQVQRFKYGKKSAVRRIAEGDETLPLPYHSAPDPIEQARYNRRMGALRTNKMRREQSMQKYREAVETAGKKKLPPIPREQANDIAKRAAIAGKSVDPKNQIVKAKLAAGETPRGVADFLEAQARTEGRDLTIPLFVKNKNGRYSIGMEVNVPAFENLLHTGKVSKPIPLTAKGELKTVKEAISETGIVETKVRGRLTYGYQKGGKPKFEAAAQHSAFLADSENLADDLARLHMIDPDSGQVVNLGAFLAKHNITPSTIQAGAAEKISSTLSGKGSLRDNPLYGLLPKEPKFKGELLEPEAPPLVHTPYSKEEVAQWIRENASDLTPQQISYILNGKGKNVVRGPEGVIKRARQIANQFGGRGGFKTMDDLLRAVDEGDVPEAQLQGIMDFLGVKKKSQIKPAIERLTKRMTAKEEIAAKATVQVDAAAQEIDEAISQVRPVEQLLDELQHSDDVAKADAKLTENLNGFERAAVDDIVRETIKFTQEGKKYKYTTRGGAKRTEPKPGPGDTSHTNTFNEVSQSHFAGKVMQNVSKQWEKIKKTPEAEGYTRADYMYQHAMPMLKAVEARLREQNLPVVLSNKASGIPMGLSDILDVLPPEFVKKYFFQPINTKALDPSQIMRIGETLIQFGSKKIDADLAVRSVTETLVGPRSAPKLAYQAAQTGQLQFSAFSKFVNKEGREKIVQEVAEVFLKATPRIMDVANMRAAQLQLEVGQHASAVSDAVIQQAVKVLADPWATTSQKTIAIADAEKMVKPTSKKATKQQGKVQAPAGSEDIAQNIVRQTVDDLDGAAAAKATAHNARRINAAYSASPLMRGDKVSSVVFNSKIMQAGIDSMKEAHDVVEKIAMETGRSLVYDLGAKVDMAFQYRLGRYMFGHIGNQNLRGLLLNRINFASTTSKHLGSLLGHIKQNYSTDEISEAFLALQEGRLLDTPAFKEVNKVFGDLFGPDPDSAGNFINMFTDLGVTAADINYHGKKFGLLDSVMFRGDETPEEMANAFRNWDLGAHDPLEELNKLHAATQNAGVMRIIGSDFSARWGVKSPPVGGKERWVKITDKSNKSLAAKMIDKDLYYPEEIARELHVLDESLKTLHDPLANSKLTRWYDGALHAWKAGFTIYRPGHHTRNAVGDGFFNYLDGVKVRHHNNAVQVLHQGRSGYKDWDSAMALKSLGTLPDEGKTVARNGKIELTARQAHKLMYRSGNLPDYKILEDIGFGQETEDVASRLRQLSPFKGKVHDVASNVSEVRDHYFRAAHWLHAFEQVKVPANMRHLQGDDLLNYMADEATRRVRKWHPDGSDLTMFEKKRMRRIIPFYSWMRKALPLVVQATVTKPGKVMVYPKAMYNMAAAMGVDLESYSNPFPEDQLFPSWIADATQGPSFMNAGHYFGIRPGIPTADLMDEYGSKPLQTLGGSLTPALKIPMEYMFDTDVRTGLEIRDTSDWVDRQVPGLSHLASLTGHSPSSVIGDPRNGIIDPTQATETARKYDPNESGLNQQSLLNLLTGAGVMDMSKPNYIKSAELEQKYKARDLYRKMQEQKYQGG